MKDVETIDEPEQLKALSDPRRLELLKILVEGPHTVAELAEELETDRDNLYYHLSELEDLELIEVVEERKRGNLLEKHYAAVAEYFSVDRGLFAERPEGLEMLLESVGGLFDAAELDLRKLVDSGALTHDEIDRVFHAQRGLRIAPDRIEEFRDDLEAVIEEYSADDVAPRVIMTLVAYPSPRHASEETEDED